MRSSNGEKSKIKVENKLKRGEAVPEMVNFIQEKKLNSNSYITCVTALNDKEILVDNFAYGCILKKNTLKVAGYVNSEGKRINCAIILEKSGMIVAATGGQNVMGFDTNKDLQNVMESGTRREAWCMASVDNDRLFLCGQNEGHLTLFESRPERAKFYDRFTHDKFKKAPIWKIVPIETTSQFQNYAVCTWGAGMKIVEIDEKAKTIYDDGHFYLAGHDVQDVMQLRADSLLVSVRYMCKYYVIDTLQQTATEIAKGLTWSISMSPFPDFDVDTYPYVFAREDYNLTILNCKTGNVFNIVEECLDFRPLS